MIFGIFEPLHDSFLYGVTMMIVFNFLPILNRQNKVLNNFMIYNFILKPLLFGAILYVALSYFKGMLGLNI